MKPALLSSSLAVLLLLILAAALAAFYIWLSHREGGMAARLKGKKLALLWSLRALAALMVVGALMRPAISVVQTEERLPSVGLLLDDSTSMNFPDARDNPLLEGRPANERTRGHTAADVAVRLQQKLALTHRVRVYGFSDTLRLMKEIPHRDSESDPSLSKSDIFAEGFKPAGEYSNVGDAINDAMREMSNDRIAALVLLSDGRETGGTKLELAGANAAASKVPVHAVALGSEFPLRDLRIDEVLVDPEGSLGDVLPFRVKITNQISEQLSVTLSMTENGKAGPSRALRLKRGTSTINIGAILDNEGIREFKLSLPKQADEVNVANNEAIVHVTVTKRDLRVLLVSGASNREYLQMEPALLRDPIINLACYLQPAEVGYIQQGRTNLTELPKSTEAWNAYDVVVLNDPDPNGFDVAHVAGMEAMVNNGGGLVVVGGYTHGLAKFIQVHAAKIRGLLPVEIDKNAVFDYDRIWDKPFSVERVASEKIHPVLQASANEKLNDEIWATFPQMHWHHPVQSLKSKAVCLLQRAGPRDEGGGTPLIATHRYGRGGVLYIGLTSLWRWRFPAESYDYDRFLSGAIRYLGQTRLSGAQQQVVLETERRVYAPGEEVKLSLRVLDPALLSQLDRQQLVVFVETGKKDRQPVELKPDPQINAIFRGTFRPRDTGSMLANCRQAAPNADSEAKPLFDAKCNFQVRLESLEDRDTSANLEGLKAVSEQTGGTYYDYRNMQNIDQLAAAIPPDPQILSQEIQMEVWDRGLFLLVFLALVCAEWSMRKLWGLL